ncbi:hypothetical protein M885DRAFT_505430 [Pelagophyceae sp. CCMP2097]|nr:hypothetical protein M885DRAFT_505430 [Pelagophyceae sp. CCMP2097]
MGRPSNGSIDRAGFFDSERGLDALRIRAAAQNPAVKCTTAAPSAQAISRDPYSDDAVLLRLEKDVSARVWGHQKTWLYSIECCCPLISCAINCTLCPTLYLCCCFPAHERKVAKAHDLILRERTLLYTVKAHTSYSELQRSNKYVPSCCEPNICGKCCGVEVTDYIYVVRLADVGEITVLSGERLPRAGELSCCGKVYQGPDELVVKNLGGSTVAAISGPQNAQVFMDAFVQQRQRVLESGLDAEPREMPPDAPAPGLAGLQGMFQMMQQGGGPVAWNST